MDELIRKAAFQWLEKQFALCGGIFPRKILEQGYYFHGNRITLIGPTSIWKPAAIKLSLDNR